MSRTVIKISEGIGNTMYKVSCDFCEDGWVFVWKPQDMKYKCKICKLEDKEMNRRKNKNLRELEAERRLEIAIEYLERKGTLHKYSKALDVVGKNLYRKNWFESSNEILVALELIRNGHKIRHQVKMGRWRVDFIIPELKVVLEVDGELFHGKEKREKEIIRDHAIIAHLGPDWEVIRIDDRVLKKNIQKLTTAIHKVKEERDKMRRGYNVLPEWYSKRHL